MLRTTVSMMLLLCAGAWLPLPAGAQTSVGADNSMPLPPPPGPYVSSRPQLELAGASQRNNNQLPFVSNMPSMPMRYMPTPRQLPAPPPWWRRSMGY